MKTILVVTKYTALIFLAMALTTACLTTADLQRVESGWLAGMASVESKLEEVANQQATLEDVTDTMKAETKTFGELLEDVKVDVEGRTVGFLEGIQDPSGAAQAGIAGAVLWWLRDRRRKRNGEPTTPPPATP